MALEELVALGVLRCDLYYRLDVFTIHVPPLRERPEDIGPLAGHFLAELGRTRRRTPRRLGAAALDPNRWNRAAAARELGISYAALRYRMMKLGI